MYIKYQASSGHVIQEAHTDEIYVRKDVIHPGDTSSDIAFRDIWGSDGAPHDGGCPLVCVIEQMNRARNEDGTFSDEDGSFVVVVVYFKNKHGMTQALVCDSVVYILSDEGKTLDIHRA